MLDDRLLIEELLVGLPAAPTVVLHTTSLWHYRACRAAVLGAGGHLSGPFARLKTDRQGRAVLALLQLRDDIGLPEPRTTVPVMAELATRHPRLNVLNLEAVAFARVVSAKVWLSVPAAAGILPAVLDDEGVDWSPIPLD